GVCKDSIRRTIGNIYTKHLKRKELVYLLLITRLWAVYPMYYEESYGNGWTYIIIMWLTQLIAITTKPIAIALKVKEITYTLFLSHLYAALMMRIIGYVAIKFIGDNGLILAMLGAYIVANVTNYIYYHKVFYNTEK